MYDVLFKNATLIDGSGAPRQQGSLAIKGGRIAAVGALVGATAHTTIDATDLVLSPGFIDIHSHSDGGILHAPEAESRILQGVTSELGGNCGTSPRISQGPSSDGSDAGYTDLPAYFSALETEKISTNLGMLIGHGAVRAAVIGYDNRPATEADLDAMRLIVDQAMKAGAFGMSSGLIYPPSSYADVHELCAVAMALQDYYGIYETHMRHEDGDLLASLEEAATVGIYNSIPVEIAHLKVTGRKNWNITMHAGLAYIDKLRRQGVDITMDQYPYTASSTSLNTLVPQWVHDGGREKFLERLSNPETRARIRQEILDHVALAEEEWSDYQVSRLPSGNHPDLEGKNLAEIAIILGKEPVDAALDLLVEEKGNIARVKFAMSEEDVELAMSHPFTMIGSDGGASNLAAPGVPHPRSFATFARVLGHYSRNRKLFSLETAIQKMTGMPAWRMRLGDRGLLRPGFSADLVLFDPETVIDTPTYTKPKQACEGIKQVYVNGILTAEDGKHTGARAGMILRRS